jgi:hypothetical protein
MRKPKNYWTLKRTRELMQSTLNWMSQDENNVFIHNFIFDNYGIAEVTISHLLKKFPDDEEITKTWSQIKDIQKDRIIVGALSGKYRENMAKFILNCNFNMIPKSQQQIEVKGDNIKFDFGVDKPE